MPLRDYLDSLELVRGLPDRRLLPAHGPVAPSVHARVDELIEHRHTRLAQIDETVTRARPRPRNQPAGCCGPGGADVGEVALLSRCWR